MSIFATIHALRKEISVIKQQAKLVAGKVEIMGVTKGQPTHNIEEAIEAGLTVFGENRVQEAKEKWPAIKSKYPDIKLHLIGSLQTNKVKEALTLFDVIETVDRPKLVEVLGAELRVLREKNTQYTALKTQHFYIQVNTGKEPQKSGVVPEETDALITLCRQLQIPITGLMCIPPDHQPPAPHFALLQQVARRHGLAELSMGMSGDWKEAVKMGSTCIRIGTAIFGERVSS